MKNLISILILCVGLALSSQVSAQVTPMTQSNDTITNGATENLTLQVRGGNNVVSIEYVATKVSGTVAGTATLQGSINGVAYSNIPVAVIKGGVNAFTNTNITTNSYVWVIEPSSYQYYRVAVVGTGTMVAVITGAVMTR